MLHTHHFAYGWVTPVIAYIMSFTGSLLGLQCARRARVSERPGGWLVGAAVAIGGTGIWVMHFVAMLGFSIDGASIRYNVPLTLASAVIAVVVVWIGLSLVTRGQRAGRDGWTLLTGGLITGLGVGAMHYAGMFAMRTDATLSYSLGIVALSLVIAVVAATAALWFALHVRGTIASIGAAIIMGIAVCGMHYTGMTAMHAEHLDPAPAPHGADGVQLLLPLMIGVSVVTMMLLINVGLTDNEDYRVTPAPAGGGTDGSTGRLR
ncbi:MHYT domain-containing protein [Nocardia sp. alder85J]|uniref:MHYT domain-containing protein n=1 Tax=Nocardia sp. alder85J TaxID=2862949 RepID=UPI001CD61194|nr:MHYT domain-containing protein [Nocardia sp. alder85J]MCX4094853.1 hypothetical protein [Nocardia sp. alder85J]